MVTKLYFKIDPTHEVAQEHNAYMSRREKAILAAREYVKTELLGDSFQMDNSINIVSIIYKDHDQVPKGLRPKPQYSEDDFVPNKRTKIGKTLAEKFKSFRIEKDRSRYLIDHKDFISSSHGGLAMYSSQVWRLNKNEVFALVPIDEENSFSPPEGFTEILASEFNKIYASRLEARK
ncbi:MAG: hypothetical protein NE330_15100 [Lentisphaeraceae bacterium]|nr:hypothetical protein [Lentisphaeraceae bacterium]